MSGWVYILRLSSGKFYVGSTTDIQTRMTQHAFGLSNYTSKFLPVELIFQQEFDSYKKARKAENWLKRNKDRRIIKKIIEDKVLKKKFDI